MQHSWTLSFVSTDRLNCERRRNLDRKPFTSSGKRTNTGRQKPLRVDQQHGNLR